MCVAKCLLRCSQPLGHHVLRRRLMTAMGWEIISVPYFEWMELQWGMNKEGVKPVSVRP